MENTSAIRRRANRNARESTPEPTKKLIRESRAATDGDAEDINTVYVVKGVLNVGGGSGAASPTGSISSSSSSSGNGGRSTGSHAYRAKILRYMCFTLILNDDKQQMVAYTFISIYVQYSRVL